MSVIILALLVAGVLAGVLLPDSLALIISGASTPILLLLLFTVGVDIGVNKQVFLHVRQLGLRVLLIPLGVILGSLFGGFCAMLMLGEDFRMAMAISSGLGWYSLSGVLLAEAGYPVEGAVSVLTNVFREIFAFITIPLLAKYVSYHTAIAPAGAAAMDSTLGVIRSNTDAETAVVAFISGSVCTLAVPVLMGIFV